MRTHSNIHRYKGDKNRYNLPLVQSYESQLRSPLLTEAQLMDYDQILIKVPMPNCSLIVMYGPARYQFEHSVLRKDITARRVCIAYREFTPMYLEHGNYSNRGVPILETAQHFWNEMIDSVGDDH